MKNLEITKLIKKCIRNKNCNLGLKSEKYWTKQYIESDECKIKNCPFYIQENDSGYYQHCTIGQIINNFKKLNK